MRKGLLAGTGFVSKQLEKSRTSTTTFNCYGVLSTGAAMGGHLKFFLFPQLQMAEAEGLNLKSRLS